MKFEVSVDRESSESLSIHVKGDINFHTSPALRKVMSGCFADRLVRSVRIVLNDVARMDSSGIATLVEGLQWSRSPDKQFVISGLTGAVRDLVVLSNLEHEFEIAEAGE
ncbi:MAG: STAS domain-containing protein [Mariprofundaceae bacterium]|nr:STAS domain-containing protein [Mariprofundaceae bacterium]